MAKRSVEERDCKVPGSERTTEDREGWKVVEETAINMPQSRSLKEEKKTKKKRISYRN